MQDNFITIRQGIKYVRTPITTSQGEASAYRIPMTTASGRLDETLFPASIFTKSIKAMVGETINGGIPVVLINGLLFRAKASEATHFQKVIGVSKQAGEVGDVIEVIQAGVVDANVESNLIYYLALNGGLTVIAPTTGIFQVIGFGLENNKLFVNVSQAIWR